MKKLLMALAVLCSVSAAHAELDYYAVLCAWAPGQIPSATSSEIWGFRGTLFYGDCLRMKGLDLATGANRTRERFDGLGIALVYNYANSLAGMENWDSPTWSTARRTVFSSARGTTPERAMAFSAASSTRPTTLPACSWDFSTGRTTLTDSSSD